MKISGFTIIRNAVLNDYPIVQAIKSILPIVDEMVVLVGNSEDDTKKLVESIGDPKIKIFESEWDNSLTKGGQVLAVETDKAFRLIDPESTWAFYIQADEMVHEKYYESIAKSCEKYKNNKEVQGLLFDYVHFYGSYKYIGDSRKWYQHEVRIIRNDKSISSYKDAQGFRIGKTKLNVKHSGAAVYHYGWVKTPQKMDQKIKNVSVYWAEGADEAVNNMPSEDHFNYEDFDSLSLFTGTHPLVMKEKIEAHNFDPVFDLKKKNFSRKDKLLYWIEKHFGRRLFTFRNYKVIR